MIAGILWIVVTMVGDNLLEPFNKAIGNKNWLVVVLIGIIMLPFFLLNFIVTPFLEHE